MEVGTGPIVYRTGTVDYRNLIRDYEIGWLEGCWLEFRAYAQYEAGHPGATPLAPLRAVLSGDRREAFDALVIAEARTRAQPSAGVDTLPAFIDSYAAEQPFFAAIAAIEQAFQWCRFGGNYAEASRVFYSIREHARTVGDVPVAAQMLAPPDSLKLASTPADWYRMIDELDTLEADPRLRGELRLQRLLDRPELRAEERLDLALEAGQLLVDEPQRASRAFLLAEAAYRSLGDHGAATALRQWRATLVPDAGRGL